MADDVLSECVFLDTEVFVRSCTPPPLHRARSSLLRIADERPVRDHAISLWLVRMSELAAPARRG